MSEHQKYMRAAIDYALKAMHDDQGGPFGAVVVKDGKIIGRGSNRVTSTNDPTAHAEILAIREACDHLKDFQLKGCEIYSSCEPCPMCLGAIYWARPDRLFYACSKEDAAAAGFDDAFIYREIDLNYADRTIPFESLLREEAMVLFKDWINKSDKTPY